jgi:hypothetical protein
VALNAASKGIWPLKDDLPCSSGRLALYSKAAEVIAAIAAMIETKAEGKLQNAVGGLKNAIRRV